MDRVRPVARRVARDLSEVLAPDADDQRDAAYRRLLFATSASPELPPAYRRLFAVRPIEIADLYVRRPGPEDRCAEALAAWSRGDSRALLVRGDLGAGKRTLVNHVLVQLRGTTPTSFVRVTAHHRTEAALASMLANALGLGAPATCEDLQTRIRAAGERRIVVVEQAERLLRRTPQGVELFNTIAALFEATRAEVFWVLLMTEPTAAFVEGRPDLLRALGVAAHVGPMTAADLEAMVMARHALGGYEAEFQPDDPGLVERVRHPLAVWSAREPRELWFQRCHALAGGNPRQALLLWLTSLTLRGDRVLVRPLPREPRPLLRDHSLPKRLVLAVLAQQGSASRDELCEILTPFPRTQVLDEIEQLRADGYVTPHTDAPDELSLPPAPAHSITVELRRYNLV
jgi:tRNA A37 threonylcarbamoyladenosine biosynthesis protein TsaE